MSVSRFEHQTSRDHGHLMLMGRDTDGNEIYALGRHSSGQVISHILPGIARALGCPDNEVVTLDTMPSVNLRMRLGGTLSRGLGIVTIGRPIVIAGCKAAHSRFCAAVDAFRAGLRRLPPAPTAPTESAAPDEAAAVSPTPIVVYYCHGGAHSSVTAAAIHLKALPSDRRPTPNEVAGIPYFDRTTTREIGTLFFCGTDEGGRRIYITGMIRGAEIVRKSIRSLLDVLGIPQERLTFVNCLPLIHVWTRVGGFLSRQLGMVSLGRPITIQGILANYARFVATVKETRARLTANDGR